MDDYQYPTDPYGHLEWAVGIKNNRGTDSSNMICFDYAELEDGKVRLHAVINVDTAGYIEDLEKIDVSKAEAPGEALRLCRQALEWCYEGGDGDDEVDIEGWNQDPFYFYRCVKADIEDNRDDVPRIRSCTCGKHKQNPYWENGKLRNLCLKCALTDPL